MMTEHEQSLWQHFEAAHAGDISPEDFEQWLAEASELETVIGSTLYLELISLDFHGPYPARDLYSLIERIYAEHRPSSLLYDRARRIATEFLAGKRDLWEIAAFFSLLWSTGHESWVPMEFYLIDAELDSIPRPKHHHLWRPAELNQLLTQNEPYLRSYEQRLRAAATQVINTVDNPPDHI